MDKEKDMKESLSIAKKEEDNVQLNRNATQQKSKWQKWPVLQIQIILPFYQHCSRPHTN